MPSIASGADLVQAGYLYLPSYHPNVPTEEIVQSLGSLIRFAGRSLVHQLKPKSVQATTPNTYSGIYGHNGFPLHTDQAHRRFPPRLLVLRCVKGYAAVPTLLVDSAAIINDDNRSVFSRALVRPRRPIDGSMPLLHLYAERDGGGMLRWDEVFIRPASAAGEVGLKKFAECLSKVQPLKVALANPGDTLIVDNWRMLHGRSPVPPGCQARVLDRVYLEEIH
jgi:L-asparagine oxygenase